MANNGRLFPYSKAIILNAIYDALDELSFIIDRSNSVRGTLYVTSSTFPEINGKIAISPTPSGEQTLVEVFTDHADENQYEWIDALMDETQSLIRRTGIREAK